MTDASGWVVVYESRRRWTCHDFALVLDALGIPHLIADGPNNAALLLVPAGDAGRAQEQLRLYEAENRPVRPPPPLRLHGYGLPGVAVYGFVIAFVFLLQRRFALGIDWIDAGILHGAAVRNGEWWRIVTALTLHGDAGHIIANLAFGSVFGALAGQYLGSGVAWAVIVLAAAMGNALDVALLPPGHRAIGASTAVFAALGVIASFVWLTQARRSVGWARRAAPIVGAVVLLAYIGTGDEKTDVVAHLTGFMAGIGAGALCGLRRPQALLRARVQIACGVLTVAVVAACWWLALEPWRSGLV